MAGGEAIEHPFYHKAFCGILFLMLAALPWVDLTNLSTLLLLASAALSFAQFKSAKSILNNKLILLSAAYYILYIVALARFPDDAHTRFALQQKAAFLVVPSIFYLIISRSPKIWAFAVWGMIAGVSLALMCCLANAMYRYSQLHNTSVFFYHNYVSLLSANAIYTSVETLVAMVFVIRMLGEKAFETSKKTTLLLIVILLFLLVNLLLLSSKMLIVTGILILVFSAHRYKLKAFIYSSVVVATVLLLTTDNQIKQRYLTVQWEQYASALKLKDYSNTQFDGLNLRLLIWRMGNELVTEQKAFLGGLGGRHYQDALNKKIAAYKLYHGYQNMDLHNQYMESYVGFGIMGLIVFLTLIGYLPVFAIQKGRKDLMMLCMIFCVSFLTESLLENQAGILLFIIIISGEWIQAQLY